jgi:hypothetical protein
MDGMTLRNGLDCPQEVCRPRYLKCETDASGSRRGIPGMKGWIENHRLSIHTGCLLTCYS